ncbi:Heterogeneous nuclear ribonucleoprotein A1 [Echinococcus granulosus]|uniref:Heterogeneous nuclear ribonucleoprotein A1 n=1 Tax=Echinococcus granulosus TaxID=6210 RepID=W6U7M6_ECHGR|nr:Heterogeneous nuclear ribonucleoprotein A1 [Echinococcus granulosus]EUB57180.1 Heterogeneous nuclear ribonucleoprotein A1 [Echinococcus granulosus]
MTAEGTEHEDIQTPHVCLEDIRRNVTTPNTTVQKSRVKLYVGGLRPNHTEGQLRRHFAQYGTVTDFHIVRDPKTDESKCFGFVTFQEETHATRALVDCPHFIEGGPVYVKASIIKTKAEKEKMAVSSAAIDMNEKLEGTDEGSGIGGGQEVDKLRLFVGSLSPSTTQQALKEHFSHYGNVTRVDVILERESGKPRGIAFNLQEAMAMQKSLEELLVKVAPLGKMVKNLPPHPITQLQISDKFDKKIKSTSGGLAGKCFGLPSKVMYPDSTSICIPPIFLHLFYAKPTSFQTQRGGTDLTGRKRHHAKQAKEGGTVFRTAIKTGTRPTAQISSTNVRSYKYKYTNTCNLATEAARDVLATRCICSTGPSKALIISSFIFFGVLFHTDHQAAPQSEKEGGHSMIRLPE